MEAAAAGRPRFQIGQITMGGGWWVLRYRDYLNGDGRKDCKLCLVADNTDLRDPDVQTAQVRFADKIAKCRAEINQGSTNNARGLNLADSLNRVLSVTVWSTLPRFHQRPPQGAGDPCRIFPNHQRRVVWLARISTRTRDSAERNGCGRTRTFS
jgi:hypothetical protein